jgi:hypothetical protein
MTQRSLVPVGLALIAALSLQVTPALAAGRTARSPIGRRVRAGAAVVTLGLLASPHAHAVIFDVRPPPPGAVARAAAPPAGAHEAPSSGELPKVVLLTTLAAAAADAYLRRGHPR